jgi:sarcosine oxidase subunit gamma
VAKFTLTEIPAFGGFKKEVEGGVLVEETGYAIIALTIRTGAVNKFKKAFNKFYGKAFPSTRESLTVGETIIVPSAIDQVFIIEETDPHDLENQLIQALGKYATMTDQTDGWGILTLSGPKTITTMEQVSPVDMDITAFPVGAVARTVLEHVDGIVVRQKAKDGEIHRFMLLSQRSSAASFLHSITATTPFAY